MKAFRASSMTPVPSPSCTSVKIDKNRSNGPFFVRIRDGGARYAVSEAPMARKVYMIRPQNDPDHEEGHGRGQVDAPPVFLLTQWEIKCARKNFFDYDP